VSGQGREVLVEAITRGLAIGLTREQIVRLGDGRTGVT
jgi:hypothetical protein